MSVGRSGGLTTATVLPVAAASLAGSHTASASSYSSGLTAGSWVVCTSSTSTRLLLAQMLTFAKFTYTVGNATTFYVRVEVGVGAPGSEQVVAASICGGPTDTGAGLGAAAGSASFSTLVDIPAGSAVSVRALVSATATSSPTITAACETVLYLINPANLT